MSEQPIVLDPRLVGKKIHNITAAFVDSQMTDEERSGQYNPIINTVQHTENIELNTDGSLSDSKYVFGKVVDKLNNVDNNHFVHGDVIENDSKIYYSFVSNIDTTSYMTASLYFMDKWKNEIAAYDKQMAEYAKYVEYKAKFSEYESEFEGL